MVDVATEIWSSRKGEVIRIAGERERQWSS